MNTETINYIVKIAGFAADQLASGKTLKASKLWLADAMDESTTPYTHVDGVDFAVVNSRRSLIEATNARTKAVFANQCKTAITGAESNRGDAIMSARVAHAIKIAARDHGVELHAADVIEWANGDIYFNFTKAAKELAEAAKEAAPVEVEGVANIAEAAGLFDLWELFDRSPMKLHIDNLEMHYVDALNDEKAGGDAATAARRLFGFCEGDTLTYAFNAVCNQAREDLQIHIEASHDEALAIEAERALEAHWREAQEERAAIIRERDAFQLSGLYAKRQAIEAAHVEALKENDRFDWLANRYALFFAGCDFGARRTMIETAHSEALYIEKENAYITAKEHDTMINAMRGCHAMGAYHAANPDTLESAEDRAWRELPDALLPPVAEVVPDCIKQPEPNKGGRPRKVLAATAATLTTTYRPLTKTSSDTYEVWLNNGKNYVYVAGIRRLYLLCGGKVRHYLKVIRNERILAVVEAAVMAAVVKP